MAEKKPVVRFPKKFLWGAATAAHQIEGGTENQWTVWERENAKTKAAQAKFHWGDLEAWEHVADEAENPATYISAEGADHYHLYEDDFDLIKKLNMNAFRFSVEWSRVEPTEGAWNVEAINHYKRYVAELAKRNIEPVVTLFHFTLPLWFAEMGGFEKRANVQYFVRFADKILQELGTDIKYVITVNEPEVYAFESYWQGNWPPSKTDKKAVWHVLGNLARAHNEVAQLAHALSRRYKVSIAKNSNYFYAGDDALLSRKYTDLAQYFQDDYFLRKVVKTCDFIGVNYYFSNRIYGYRIHNPEERVSDLGWDLSPANLQFALERLHEKYHLPLFITENGVADAKDQHRKWWLAQTILAMQKAMENGVELRGYLHWSLLDNFEWDKGFWPRFGLVHVDYKTKKRTLRGSSVWFAKVIKRLRTALSR
jgi:beta-glucosidase